jgi:Leucine-rich repeat (LRR) protein
MYATKNPLPNLCRFGIYNQLTTKPLMKPFLSLFLFLTIVLLTANAQNQPKTTKSPCEKASTLLAQARTAIEKKNYKTAINKIIAARINCPTKATDADNILLKLIENRNENAIVSEKTDATDKKNTDKDKIDKAVVIAQNAARIAALETEINAAKTERDAAFAVRKSQAQALRESDSMRSILQINLRVKDSLLTKTRTQLADAQQVKQKFQSGIMTKALRQWETKKGVGASKNSLERIDTLDLSYNMLSVLPDDVLRCKNLRSINLIGNKDLSVPATLAALQSMPLLTDIRLSATRTDSILPVHYTKITHLDMSGSEITTIMADIANFANLRQLDLGNNKLLSLPAEIGELKQLVVLNINDNRLTRLPNELGNLPLLKMLNLSNNKLADLPDALGKLPQLALLDLSNNKMVALNANILTAPRLTELNVSRNQLESLPAEIGKMPALQNLLLTQNHLTTLPTTISKIKKLQQIDLSQNMFGVFPEAVFNLKTLKKITLSGNTIKPEDIEKAKLKTAKRGLEIVF